jgi:hypothetical protein
MAKQPSSVNKKKFSILLYSENEDISERLNQGLRSKGYRFVLTTSLTALYRELQSIHDPIIVYLLSERETQIKEEIKDIIEKDTLTKFPLIVAGPQASAFSAIFEKFSEPFSTIDYPFTSGDIIKEIEVLERKINKKKAVKVQKEVSELNDNDENSQIDGSSKHHPESGEQSSNEEKGFPKIADLFFQRLQDLNLQENSPQGNVFSKVNDSSKIPDASYLPQDKDLIKEVTYKYRNLSKWHHAHIHRIAYFTNEIIQILRIPEPLSTYTKNAAFLFPISLVTNADKYLRTNYLVEKNSTLRIELCSKIKDSAIDIIAHYQLHEAASIVSELGKLIGREKICTDDEIDICASIILAADMFDRACWLTGSWDPNAANRLLKACQKGKITEIHPTVLICIIKILVEAIAQTPQRTLIPLKFLKNPEMMKEIEKNQIPSIPGDHEKLVSILSLSPGMVLSQPLKGIDGKTVLLEDVKLDEDLIWRIWSLSAVYALQNPLIFDEVSTETLHVEMSETFEN